MSVEQERVGGPAEESRKDPLGNIARRVVQLQKEYLGKGPTKARVHANDEMVVVLLREPFTVAEQTLAANGQIEALVAGRRALHTVMNQMYIPVVEEETGRKVSAVMSTNHVDPDLAVKIFVFEEPGAGG
jgi:uncharacterized protein YbcI